MGVNTAWISFSVSENYSNEVKGKWKIKEINIISWPT